MLNDRQYMIIELLSKAPSPMRAEEIAKIVVKSKRTIMRDLSTIKVFLEANHIGELLLSGDQQGYKIQVSDYTAYEEVMKKNINDEQLILYQLVNRKFVTIEDLTDILFVSRITASEKLGVIKETYSSVLNIAVSNKGHRLQESNVTKCFLLSNLIETNTKYYLELAKISSEQYELLLSQIKHSDAMKAYFPNVLGSQIANLFVAAHLFAGNEREETNEELEYICSACALPWNPRGICNLIECSDYCIETNLNLTINQIRQVLQLMEEENNIAFFNSELPQQLYHHLKRILCYPQFLKTKEIHNIANIKALYPFSFDLGLVFIQYMNTMYHYRITNSDLIGLYFTVGMEEMMKKNHAVFIYSNANSIANINRQLIEASISNCQVTIGNTFEGIELEDYSLVINSTEKEIELKIPIFKTEYILSEKDIADVREILENISIGYNLKSIFPKEYSYTYQVAKNESWREILENICTRLVNELAISQEEARKIIEREESGNPLIINNFSIPHCISKRENFVICVYINLDQSVLIEGSPVSHVLLTVMNPAMNKSINIFKFLYRYLQTHEEQLTQIRSYDEFISYI